MFDEFSTYSVTHKMQRMECDSIQLDKNVYFLNI